MHFSVLSWRIPGAGEHGGLMSMGSHRVGHNWSDLAAAVAPWKKSNDNLGSVLKSRDITLPTKVCMVKAMFFSVVMCRCKSWIIKKAKHWIDAFKLWCWRRLVSPLDCKEIKPVHPKGNQLWIFTGRTDADAEAAKLWSPHSKNQLTGKGHDAGKDWRQEQKGMPED